MKNYTGYGRKRSRPNLKYYPGKFPEGLRNSTENLSQDSWYINILLLLIPQVCVCVCVCVCVLWLMYVTVEGTYFSIHVTTVGLYTTHTYATHVA
jgi:hypothetical protein